MNDAINHAIINQVMKDLRTGNIRRCLDLGFNHDELNQLSQMPPENIMHLSSMPVPFTTVTVNHDLLARSFERVNAECERQNLIRNALQRGASIQMMMTYFGISSEEVSTRRRIMGISLRAGRLPMPADEMSEHAWRRWEALTRSSGLRIDEYGSLAGLDVMILLAEETGLALAVLWELLRTWYPKGDRKKARKPKRAQ